MPVYDDIRDALTETNPFAVIMLDTRQTNYAITYVNKAFEDLTGYDSDEVIGTPYERLLDQDNYEIEYKSLHKALADDRNETVVVRHHLKNGEGFWAGIKLFYMRDHHEAVKGYTIWMYDVTFHKVAKDNLLRSSEFYHQMFEGNRAVKLIIHAETGRIIDANTAACEFYGYSCEQIKAMTIQDINTLAPHEVYKRMQDAQEQQETFFQFRHRLASGEIRDVDVFSSPITTSDGQYLYSIIFDMSSRQELQTRYRSLFDQSNDAVFMLDMHGNHIEANHRASQMMGYTAEEMRKLSYTDLVISDEQDASTNVLRRLQVGEKIPPYERTFLHKDGSHIPCEINVELVRDNNQQPVYIQSIVRDISNHKQLVNRLQENEHRLKMTIDATQVGTWDWNVITGETKFNERWAEIIGYTLEELSPTTIETWAQLAHPDDLANSNEILQRHFAGELPYYKFEARMHHKDGHWVWIKVW